MNAPPVTRFVVALPAAVAAAGFLQARLRFRARFGSRGVYNFGDIGPMLDVADGVARAAVRAREVQIGIASAAIGTAVGVAAVVAGR